MISLKFPSEEYAREIFSYKQEMIEVGDTQLSGCGSLHEYEQYDLWVAHLNQYSNKKTIDPASGYVEGSQWVLVDDKNNHILGMVNIRHELNNNLLQFGGHIGYSIRPSERRKGYAKMQLQYALEKVHKKGVNRVLLTCNDDNVGSIKTIEYCGGKLENKVHLQKHGIIRRYWIDL